ncbi:MAG: GDSL-type esterase/lipase family protein [Eubacterium sp.]
MLGENYCVNNFGYTNRTAIKSADYPYTDEKLYQQSLDFKPDIVVIMLGSNDSKENNWNRDKFTTDYCEIIESYLKLESHPKVYMLTPPPLFEVNGKVMWQFRKNIVDEEICPSVKRIADKTGVQYLAF